jgi:hypothetical protein
MAFTRSGVRIPYPPLPGALACRNRWAVRKTECVAIARTVGVSYARPLSVPNCCAILLWLPAIPSLAWGLLGEKPSAAAGYLEGLIPFRACCWRVAGCGRPAGIRTGHVAWSVSLGLVSSIGKHAREIVKSVIEVPRRGLVSSIGKQGRAKRDAESRTDADRQATAPFSG